MKEAHERWVEPGRVEEESGRLVGERGGVHRRRGDKDWVRELFDGRDADIVEDDGFYGDHTVRDESRDQNFNKYRRDALKNKQWYDELPTRGRFSHTRGTVSKKAGKVIALYNGYAVCVKETIPTLHLHLMDLHQVQKNADDTHHLIEAAQIRSERDLQGERKTGWWTLRSAEECKGGV